MTNAASTGLTALPVNLRAVSAASGTVQAGDDSSETFSVQGAGATVIENFSSGEDKLLLPQGTDLSSVTVTADWEGDAWGMRVGYGSDGDSVFLRWGWKFDAAADLATGTAAPDTAGGTGGDTGEGAGPDTDPPAKDGDAEAGTGPDTLVLKVSSESYLGDAAFTVHVDGRQVGDVFTASTAHGQGSDTVTLRGEFEADARITVTFVNDLWGGTANTDRNLHIDGATFNGKDIAGAAQTVWGNYGVSLSGDKDPAPATGGEEPGGQIPDPGNAGPGSPANPDGEVNVLIRGQSNAQVFAAMGGASELERVLEEKLGTDVHILAAYETADGSNSINSATRFMDWQQDGLQQGLVDFLGNQPASIKDNPTLTVWMHNEYDQQTDSLTTDQWVSAVREDAALVRDALGQDASTTPYEFVPIRYPYGGNFDAIGNGMQALAADGSFNADMSSAATDAVMDGDGFANSSHMGSADAQQTGRELGEELAAVLAPFVGDGTHGSTPDQATVRMYQTDDVF